VSLKLFCGTFFQIGIPNPPDVERALLSIGPPRDAAAKILLDIEEAEMLSIKLRNFILLDIQHHRDKLMKFLDRRAQFPEIGNHDISNDMVKRSAEDLENACDKIALFSFEFANLIKELGKGNFNPSIPAFDLD
jgi:hypothetical protein